MKLFSFSSLRSPSSAILVSSALYFSKLVLRCLPPIHLSDTPIHAPVSTNNQRCSPLSSPALYFIPSSNLDNIVLISALPLFSITLSAVVPATCVLESLSLKLPACSPASLSAFKIKSNLTASACFCVPAFGSNYPDWNSCSHHCQNPVCPAGLFYQVE